MKYLVVGLGNIGAEYKNTRHNIGFMAVDKVSGKKGVSFSSDKLGSVATYKFKGRSVTLLKPSTYMNLSGKAVRYWMNQLKIEASNVLIITDDIALPLTKLRLRPKGSAGGHNGLKNIQELLGTDVYPRLKVGVGSDFSVGRQADYVLGEFTNDECIDLPGILDKICDYTDSFCTIGLDRAMNLHNN